MGSVTSWIAGRWRQSLVFSLTVMGAAAVAVLGLVASAIVGNQIEQDALSRARSTAEILARSTFAPRLPGPGERLGSDDVLELDAQVAAARAVAPGTAAVLRDGNGRVLYKSDGAGAPRVAMIEPGTRVIGSGAMKRVRSVLPVMARGGRETAAYLQLDTSYAPVARDIRKRTRRLNLVLGGAALALYLLMLPTVVRAGRAVRAQYDPRRIQLAHDLKRAIKRGELELAFQPIVDSGTRELHSVEALVRWTDPRRGPISPAVFIPAVEGTPAIWDLTAHIFELAFAQCAAWCREGHAIPIAVNVSGAVLLDRRLVPELHALSKKYEVPPKMLEIEITEGALVQDPREATRVLQQIARLGLSVIAIDDFGTGYSSLARLHELPLDTLKIDQSFVMRMARDGDPAVVRSVIELAHALNMDVIAEGVETEAIARHLHELGTEHLQGYFISKPLSPADLLEWLEPRGIATRAPAGGVSAA
jgi:EAL domain-containing protein (putative c-di-GMP-specific phosphodiesterase class I)